MVCTCAPSTRALGCPGGTCAGNMLPRQADSSHHCPPCLPGPLPRALQLEKAEDLEDEIEQVLEDFQESSKQEVLHSVAFY